MRYIVAVSGGVDSAVLLDVLSKTEHSLIVAHFDHGIRPESDADARFVEGLARRYKLPFELRREELGAQASEAFARERRYTFLRDVAFRHGGKIVTAHHADDVVETIAINVQRGTGWRGLAALGSSDISRPLMRFTKRDIYKYALHHRLEWVEDETNQTDAYLRNRLRRKLHEQLPEESRQNIIKLWKQQSALRTDIDEEVEELLDATDHYSRYFFTYADDDVALELLRRVTQGHSTRPQLVRALHAIKTAKSGTTIEVGSGVTLQLTTTDFVAQILE